MPEAVIDGTPIEGILRMAGSEGLLRDREGYGDKLLYGLETYHSPTPAWHRQQIVEQIVLNERLHSARNIPLDWLEGDFLELDLIACSDPDHAVATKDIRKRRNSMLAFFKGAVPCVLGALMCTPLASAADESPIQNRFKVNIYCNDGRLDNTGTSQIITVSFYNGEKLLYQDHNPRYGDHLRDQRVDTPGATGTPGSCDNQFQGSFRYPDHVVDENLSVSKIRIDTNGEDALWMDYVQLRELTVRKSKDVVGIVSYEVFDSNDPIATWGRRGGKGYCLSTDRYDSADAWEPYVDRCVPWIEFHVEGEQAFAPK